MYLLKSRIVLFQCKRKLQKLIFKFQLEIEETRETSVVDAIFAFWFFYVRVSFKLIYNGFTVHQLTTKT